MSGPTSAEDRLDYRIFRFWALVGARLTLSGLVFIVLALAFDKNRETTGIFLGAMTIVFLLTSFVSALIAYSLYRARGGPIVKGPQTAEEFRAESRATGPGQHHQDVPGDQHSAGDEPEVPQ